MTIRSSSGRSSILCSSTTIFSCVSKRGGSTDGAMTLISGWASVLPLANGLSSDVLFFD